MDTSILRGATNPEVQWLMRRCYGLSKGVGKHISRNYQETLFAKIKGVAMGVIIYTEEASTYLRNQFELQFHLSKFRTMADFYDWLYFLCGSREVFDRILELRIVKQDICVDVIGELTYFQDNYHQPGVRKIRDYDGSSETYQLGSRPRVTKFYEKPSQEVFDIDYVIPEFKAKGTVIRVEVSLEKNFLPVNTISELNYNQLKGLNPFTHLRHLNLDTNKFNELPKSKKELIQSFLNLSMRVGHQRARKEFNRNRTFRRDIGTYFQDSPCFELEYAYRSRLNRFFQTTMLPEPLKCEHSDLPMFKIGEIDFTPVGLNKVATHA